VAGVFLELNGFRLIASEQEAAQATKALAAGEITEIEFAAWLRKTSSHRGRRQAKAKTKPRRR
jgi:death-on-curing protein